MKKFYRALAAFLVIAALFAGCAQPAPEAPGASPGRDLSRKPAEAAVYTPWDVNAASRSVPKRGKKPYTVMIYMNGSDLESETGAATIDLIEMLESGVAYENANIVILTGGTNRWQNNVVPSNTCALWEIADGAIYEISRPGLLNMGDPGTLAGFIEFSMNSFPAEKHALIMWDHGGGSIVGYGYDEKFLKGSLTLSDMDYAFMMAGLGGFKLELLGFDSCLMASAEMAAIASKYAKYMVASEDVEPGDGWDYGFLSALNRNPGMSGDALGKVITDSFMDFYGPDTDQILTLSVTDLSRAGALTAALDGLMKHCSESLAARRAVTFNLLSRKRNATKTFGEGTPRDNDCDMVDAGDMAAKLADFYPGGAANVLRELERCVIYNRHNSNVDLKGLSAYYIYGGRRFGRESLEIYRALNVNREYAGYLDSFFGILTSGGRVTRGGSPAPGPDEIMETRISLWEKSDGPNRYIMTGIKQEGESREDGLWPSINGQNVCMYRINGAKNGEIYAIPAEHNGSAGDIIALISPEYPDGKILGVRREDGIIIQKGFDKIEKGDKISFYYQIFDAPERESAGPSRFYGGDWLKGEEFSAESALKIEWKAAAGGYTSLMLTDVRGNEYLGAFEPTATTK